MTAPRLLTAILGGLALLAAAWLRAALPLAAVTLPQGQKPVINPMKGLMAWGENYRQDPYVAFAYVPVYWNELEPRPGQYDFQALEERCHFDRWRADGVRLVLRLVTDTPTDTAHMDIPEWLYEEMDGAGTWYDGEYGQGFSPDYENEVFRAAHRLLIAALADRYADDPQLAFVELGSLGHWGEWHVDTDAGIDPFPTQETTDEYVRHYLAVFPAHRLLLRRPYPIARDEGMGLYNDSFGLPDSHSQWLDWIREGYVSDQNGEALPAMPDFWLQAPSGGEFSPRQESGWYFSAEQFPVTLDLLRQSHTTFLGPNAPKAGELTPDEEENLRTMLAEMGYTFSIRRCTVTRPLFSDVLRVSLTWTNTGTAPLYAQWPVLLELRDQSGRTVLRGEFPQDFAAWGMADTTVLLELEGARNLPAGDYTLWAGIMDPLTGQAGVTLQLDTPTDGGLYRLAGFSL